MATRLEKLKELEEYLRNLLEEADAKSAAALAKQYRETIKEIDEIEGERNDSDELGAILERRQADGKPGAVRANRS